MQNHKLDCPRRRLEDAGERSKNDLVKNFLQDQVTSNVTFGCVYVASHANAYYAQDVLSHHHVHQDPAWLSWLVGVQATPRIHFRNICLVS